MLFLLLLLTGRMSWTQLYFALVDLIDRWSYPIQMLLREKILKVHMWKTPLAGDVEPRIIARGTPGFSGADLANLVNEAALLAARKGRRTVSMAEFEEAKDKVMMGSNAVQWL